MDFEIRPEEVKQKPDGGETFTLLHVREPWEYQNCDLGGMMLIGADDWCRASGARLIPATPPPA